MCNREIITPFNEDPINKLFEQFIMEQLSDDLPEGAKLDLEKTFEMNVESFLKHLENPEYQEEPEITLYFNLSDE